MRKKAGKAAIHWTDADANEFLEHYAHIAGEHNAHYLRAKNSLKEKGVQKFQKETFDNRKRSVKEMLEKELGERVAKDYIFQSVGKYPLTRFEVGIPADRIDILKEEYPR